MALKSKQTLLKIAFWAGSVILVLFIGIVYFPREEPGLGFWGALYYTLRLFIFEHDLPLFPKTFPLAFIYFFAPAVAVSAIGTAVTYLFRLSPALQTRFKSDHVVICGVGGIGKLLAETLKSHNVPVVGVDIGLQDTFEQWSSEHGIPVIHGDFLLRPVLLKASIKKARAVIFASGDDLVNLEGAVSAYGWLSGENSKIRLIWVHIANEKLAETARKAIRTKGPVGIRFFDTYKIAATRMAAKYFPPEISQTVKRIYILGFGKFGRDLFEVLARRYGPDLPWSVVVLDRKDCENEVFTLARELNVFNQVSFVREDIRNLHIEPAEQAYFMCTDDDIGNLSMALMIIREKKQCPVFVRMAKWPLPAMEEHLNENFGITFININELVKKGIRELPGIFSRAEPSDLKRSS